MFVTQLPKTTGNDEIDCKERDASGLQTQRQSSINVGVSSMSMLTLLLLLTLLPRAYSFLDGDTDTAKYRVEEGTNSSAGMQRGRKLIDLSHGKNGEASLRVPERTCRPSKGNLPNLVVIQEWRSAKRRPRESITLMTQLSVDRIAMLENQCRIWPDPLAAVIYVPLFRNGSNTIHPIIPTYRNTTLEDVVRAIDAFFHLMEATASCVMRAELVGQFLDPLEPDEYPINSLRNRALRMTDTELTFMLDVDFVPTPYLGLPEPGYRDVAVYNQMAELTAKKKALVLPAFEVMNRKQDLVLAQNFARNLVIRTSSVFSLFNFFPLFS